MGLASIANKYPLNRFRVELTQPDTLDEIIVLTSKHSEVTNVGFVAGKDLIWSLLQALAEVEAI